MTQERPPIPPSAGLSVDRLRKVLLLEQQRGFDDRAVMGGLDAFLRKWGQDAHQTLAHPMFRSALRRLGLVGPRYRSMDRGERAMWLGKVLQWMDDVEKTMPRGQPPKTPGRQRAAPALGAATGAAQRTAVAAPPLLRAGQGLDTTLAEVRGIGPFVAGKLARLGVATLRDLLHHFPRRHIDFSRTSPIALLEAGLDQTAVGTVMDATVTRMGRRPLQAAEIVVSDETGSIRAIWFNQPYIVQTLKPGQRVALSGRVGFFRGQKVLENPEYELPGERPSLHTGRLVPVYRLTEGLTSRRLRGLLQRAIDGGCTLLGDFLPPDLRSRLGFLDLPQAIAQAHFPLSEDAKAEARRRLAFDELFLIQLGVLARRRQWREGMPGHPLSVDRALVDAFLDSLPFVPTEAQRRSLEEILADVQRSTPMTRMLQGEVGSGKTVVALAAMLAAGANRQQAAFMAPTEILAEQHFQTVARLLGAEAQEAQDVLTLNLPHHGEPLVLGLLTGGMSRKRKQVVQELTAAGEIDILVGTHTLFQRDVEFSTLALVVVDEQHRFGVMQRMELRQKGYNPHLLVMTATPIPRTLSLTIYGDLDLSLIDQLPPGRQVVKTRWLDGSQRETAYEFIRRQVAQGRQAFIIYPLIDESATLEAAAARQEHQRLSQEVFPGLRLGLLHGRLSAKEKDSVMRDFRAGGLDILVSTAVVEVGIDVPNATVMVVDAADRFGLAQLHQFRGRVGRGEHASYCILISETPSAEASERLRLMEQLHDGFALAEEDLKLRGPGDFFGTRQSGMPDLRMARLSDVRLLEQARAEAEAIFQRDPSLSSPEHRQLAEAVARAWRERTLAPGEA